MAPNGTPDPRGMMNHAPTLWPSSPVFFLPSLFPAGIFGLWPGWHWSRFSTPSRRPAAGNRLFFLASPPALFSFFFPSRGFVTCRFSDYFSWRRCRRHIGVSLVSSVPFPAGAGGFLVGFLQPFPQG